MKKLMALIPMCFVLIAMTMGQAAPDGCDGPANADVADVQKQQQLQRQQVAAQATPTDVKYSLERYNLIRRAYWVNGERERALSLPCPMQRPLGYIVLFSGPTIVAEFTVDGKVTSLRQYLTPESEYYEVDLDMPSTRANRWLADVDGCYGDNDAGIFFFTTDGKYVEWGGEGRSYLYSDIPFKAKDPVVTVNRSLYEEHLEADRRNGSKR